MNDGHGKYPFESAQQLRMRDVFEKAARQGFYQGAKNVDLRKFEERLDRVRTKMKSHLDRHSPLWIARENRDLVEQNKGKFKLTLSPKGIAQTETSPATLAQRAINNVDQRKEQRLNRLGQMENRMRMKLQQDNHKKNTRHRNSIDM